MSEWKELKKKSLHELVLINNGIDYKSNPKGDNIIPIYGTGGIMGYTTVALNEGPAVLSGRKGSINRPFYVEGKFWNVDTIFCLKPLNGIDAKWLYYSLLNEDMTKLNEATGVPSVTSKSLYKLRINYVESNTQQRIAKILTTCDTVIEQTQAAIEKYKAIKQGMLHDLFTRGLDANGQLRPIPQQAPERYKNSELGLIPKEWELKRLEDGCMGNCSYGINAPAVDFDTKLPLYLRITDITENGEFNKHNRKCVNDSQSENYVLKEGDIVFARTGATVGKTYLYNPNDGKLIYAGFLIKFSADKTKLNSYFLKSYTETGNYWNWVSANSLRSGQPGINGNEYSSMKIAFPSIDEQNKISIKLKAIDTKLQSEEALLAKYQSIKKGLMKDLLSGEKPLTPEGE